MAGAKSLRKPLEWELADGGKVAELARLFDVLASDTPPLRLSSDRARGLRTVKELPDAVAGRSR